MKLDTLKSRIENAKNKIEKKSITIEKKYKTIEKKRNQIRKLGFDPDADREILKQNSDALWLRFDIVHLEDDIERNKKEIEETKISLEKYEAQMAGELEKEEIFLKEIPESMKQLQVELVDRWDTWDIEERERIKEDKRTLPYEEFHKKYSFYQTEMIYKTDEQIHSNNIQDAKMFILNLFYRVKHITGEVTSWDDIRLTFGNAGPVLNGYVEGKEGRCEVESICAGGYNIQRLHVRTLVKAVDMSFRDHPMYKELVK